MEIAKRLEKEELTDFTTLNWWLENWKHIRREKKKRLCGETDAVSRTIVQA